MPGAKGVVFVTLSDETGICNIVVWPKIFERFRKEAMGARLLLVEGRIQRSIEGVVHLVRGGRSLPEEELARLGVGRRRSEVLPAAQQLGLEDAHAVS